MDWLRRLRCWWRGHVQIEGYCLPCARGPRGERLIPIRGAQDFLGEVEFPSWEAPSGDGWGSALSRFASNLGEGVGKFAGRLGGEFMKSPLQSLTSALGLGATGMGIAGQLGVQRQMGRQTELMERGQKQAQEAAAPGVAFGRTTLESAAAGNLTPALQAGIDQWVSQAKADARARLAAMGLGNSTQINQLDALIDQQAMAMKGQMLAQQQETGLAGLQLGVGAGTGVMGVSQEQQQMLAQLIQQANQALGQIGGRSPAE